MAEFDPYHKWLSIAPANQPPHHYRLLGIEIFEPDPDVIDAAANRQMAFVKQCAGGEHAAESQKLLGEVAAARLCLLDAHKKAAYDLALRERMTASLPAPLPLPLRRPGVLLGAGAVLVSLLVLGMFLRTGSRQAGTPRPDQAAGIPPLQASTPEVGALAPEPVVPVAAPSEPAPLPTPPAKEELAAELPKAAPVPVVVASTETPPSAPAPVPTANPARSPVPDAAALKEARRLVREVKSDEYRQALDCETKSLLGHTLLRDAAGDSLGRFALLTEAEALAVDAQDAALAGKIAEAMSEGFALDPWQRKSESMGAIVKNAKSSLQNWSAAYAALWLIDEAVRQDQYEAARRFAPPAQAAARGQKDTAFSKEVADRVKTVETLARAFAALQSARERLTESPADAEANLAIGRFQCFLKGDWNAGLPKLAAGSDPQLKNLAEQDLARPSEPGLRQALGDGWWELADEARGEEKWEIRAHAATWYVEVIPTLTGLPRAKLQKRVEDVSERLAGAKKPPPANGASLPGVVDCTTQSHQGKMGPTFDIAKSWVLSFDFIPPSLAGGWQMVFGWGDGRIGLDPIFVRLEGNRIEAGIQNCHQPAGQAIFGFLSPPAVGQWIPLRLQYDAQAREYALYLNGALVKREAVKFVPSVDQAMPIWVGGLVNPDQRFESKVRGLWLGNVR
jgi:hypothetical protein